MRTCRVIHRTVGHSKRSGAQHGALASAAELSTGCRGHAVWRPRAHVNRSAQGPQDSLKQVLHGMNCGMGGNQMNGKG